MPERKLCHHSPSPNTHIRRPTSTRLSLNAQMTVLACRKSGKSDLISLSGRWMLSGYLVVPHTWTQWNVCGWGGVCGHGGSNKLALTGFLRKRAMLHFISSQRVTVWYPSIFTAAACPVACLMILLLLPEGSLAAEVPGTRFHSHWGHSFPTQGRGSLWFMWKRKCLKTASYFVIHFHPGLWNLSSVLADIWEVLVSLWTRTLVEFNSSSLTSNKQKCFGQILLNQTTSDQSIRRTVCSSEEQNKIRTSFYVLFSASNMDGSPSKCLSFVEKKAPSLWKHSLWTFCKNMDVTELRSFEVSSFQAFDCRGWRDRCFPHSQRGEKPVPLCCDTWKIPYPCFPWRQRSCA